MNRDDIIKLAREAKVAPMLYDGKWAITNLDRFAALVAAAEREACAKVCDALHYEVDAYGAQCAAAIRARGNT